MSFRFADVFSPTELTYLTNLPEVLAAKAKLQTTGLVYFTITLTESIRATLANRLGLDFAKVKEIPMRWIKGDTPAHKDTGAGTFEKTYLVYLNDNLGEFVLDTSAYPITANTAFVFNEGLLHETQHTGSVPRLLLGPMNEFAQPVGGISIRYYSNYTDAFNSNNDIAYNASDLILGHTTDGSIGSYTSWKIAIMFNPSNPDPYPSGVYPNGYDFTGQFGITIFNTTLNFYPAPASPSCFLEGTQLLSLVDGKEQYVPIESLKTGDLVKTALDGYQKVKYLGKGDIYNPGTTERTESRLYKCSPKNYPELKEDLYLTGCHSILVYGLTANQHAGLIKHLGNIFITDKKYRLIACVDERAEPWNAEGTYTIWHVALENKNESMNYGIYANGGLLVESCSLNHIKNRSNLTIQ